MMALARDNAYVTENKGKSHPIDQYSACPIIPRLSASVMETQLSDHQSITLDAVHHAMFIGYSARPES